MQAPSLDTAGQSYLILPWLKRPCHGHRWLFWGRTSALACLFIRLCIPIEPARYTAVAGSHLWGTISVRISFQPSVIVDFLNLDAIALTRTFWIVDGGWAHHQSTFPARSQGMYPNTVAVPLPTHSSWLNQIEIYFSIVQRKVLTPMDTPNEESLTKQVLGFQDYYQETAKPFSWKFTVDDLKRRLDALKNFALTYTR